MEIVAGNSDFETDAKVDRVGIWASVLCAVHCAVTPVLLIMMPAFGEVWAHPASHWGMALVVVPIALLMMRKGYKKHARKWVLAVGCVGVLLVIVGAILPYVEIGKTGEQAAGSGGSPAIAAASANIAEEEAESFG